MTLRTRYLLVESNAGTNEIQSPYCSFRGQRFLVCVHLPECVERSKRIFVWVRRQIPWPSAHREGNGNSVVGPFNASLAPSLKRDRTHMSLRLIILDYCGRVPFK